MTTIQEQIEQLEALRQNPPGGSLAPAYKEIDDWVIQVTSIAGANLNGVGALQGVAAAAKSKLDEAAAAIAQLPLDLSSIIQRVGGGS